jgi:hypothetical protein
MSTGFYSVTGNWVRELGSEDIWRSGTMGYIMPVVLRDTS